MTGVLHIRVQDEINSQLFQAKRWKVEDIHSPTRGRSRFSLSLFFLGGGRGGEGRGEWRGFGRDGGLPPPHKQFF